MEQIADFANRNYKNSKKQKAKQPKFNIKQIEKEQIQTFIGILIAMGINCLKFTYTENKTNFTITCSLHLKWEGTFRNILTYKKISDPNEEIPKDSASYNPMQKLNPT